MLDPEFRVFSNPEIAAHPLDPNKNMEFASYSSVQLTTRPAAIEIDHTYMAQSQFAFNRYQRHGTNRSRPRG
jgi:hypothetical protein